MQRLWANLAAVGLLLAGLGAAAATPQEEAERAAIDRARKDVDARTAAQEKACYQKFAVADCLKEVRAWARAELEGLRKREISLNDTERRRNAAQQYQRRQEKAGEQAARDARVQAEAPRPPKEAPPPRAAPTSTTLRRPATPAVRPVSDVAQSQRNFEQKQKEAQQHKADVLKRLSEQPASGRAKPLPDPQ